MKVNIVMPAFNAEKTIVKSISSVFNQSYKDWKLFVINDGSTDGTADLIKMFMGNGKVEVITQKNTGVSGARNTALAKIPAGELVAFLDADDIWNPNHLEISIASLIKGQADLVYSDVSLVSMEGKPMYAVNIAPPQPFTRLQLYQGNFIYISTVVCKSELCQAVGKFNKKYNGLEDYDYWMRAALNHSYRFFFTGQKTTTYLVRGAGSNAGAGSSAKFHAIQSRYPNLVSLKKQFDMVYDEIFEWNGYNANSQELVGKTVVDIGANRGFFTLLAKMYGAEGAFCYEANSNMFKILVSNLAGDRNKPFASMYNYAVMSRGGQKLKISDQDGSSTIGSTGLDVESVSFTSIVEGLKRSQKDLVLKMDVEGAEFDILLKTAPEIVNQFSTIYVEIHTDWIGHKTNGNQIRDYLLSAGFYQAHSMELVAWDQLPDGTRQNVRGTGTFVEKWTRIKTLELSRIIPMPEDDNSMSDLDGDPEMLLKKKDSVDLESAISAAFDDSIKILVIAICRNEVELMPHFLNHYQNFADKIILVDGGSTDGSIQVSKYHPKVQLISIPSEELNDHQLTDIRNKLYYDFKQDYDWVLVVDMDEFIDVRGLRQKLSEYTEAGITLVQLNGFQMISKDFPYDYSKPIIEQVPCGFHDEEWLSKMSIFNPKLVDINFVIGCHIAHPTGDVKLAPQRVSMFHMKYLGYKYLIEKSKRSSSRMSEENLRMGYGWHYQAQAQMTPEEFASIVCENVTCLGPQPD